jgi:hypothetical protein
MAGDSLAHNPLLQLTISEPRLSQSHVTIDGQSASLSWCQATIWGPKPDFYYCQTVARLMMWCAFSDERKGLSFTTAAGPRHRSHSGGLSPTELMTIFYCLRFETPPNWRARPQHLYPQEEGGPVIPTGTGFPFRRLRLAGLRWRHSNPPPHGATSISKSKLCYDRRSVGQSVLE